MAGWIPPGRAGDPLKWQLDLQKGWLPPGTVGNPAGVQYEMGHDFDPADRDVGYQFLHSPPGVAAPEHAINWTPGVGGKGEIHGPGVQAPIDRPNISVLPVGAARTSWRDQLQPQGGVGSGQAGGTIDPNADWRKSAILQDSGGLYVGSGEDPKPAATSETRLPTLGTGGYPTVVTGADGTRYKEWEDTRTEPEYEGTIYHQRVGADDQPIPGAEIFVFRKMAPYEIEERRARARVAVAAGRQAEEEDAQRRANEKLPGGKWETDKDKQARLDNEATQQRAQEANERAAEDARLRQEAADRLNNPKPETKLVSTLQSDGTTVTRPVSIDANGKPTVGPVIEDLTTAAGQKPPTTWTSPDGTLYERGADGTWAPAKGIPASAQENKGQVLNPGQRIVRKNPDTGTYEQVYKADPNWQIAQVGNKLVTYNPETRESRVIAEAPEQIRQMGNGIFFVPAGQTLKITGAKGGDRMVSGGPKEGWASQDPTKTSTPGLSLFGTEDENAQRSFTAAAGGDKPKAQDLWSTEHQGDLNKIKAAGLDPATARLQDIPPSLPPVSTPEQAAAPTPPQEDWAPPPVLPGMEGRPQGTLFDGGPWIPLPPEEERPPKFGEGQAAGPPPWSPTAAPPQGGVGPETGWQPPLDPSQVVGGGNKFGDQVSMEGTHMGTDLQAYKGTPAMSPVDGQVVAVKSEPSGLGLQVSIRDAQGQIHTLAHLDNASVQQGEQVRMGQNVAAVGESGAGATGPHLDYRIAGPDGTPVNPEPRMGQLAQLPPHPNTVGEGQAKKGWKPKVGSGQEQPAPVPPINSLFNPAPPVPSPSTGGGGTIDASLYQEQMNQQANQFKKSLAVSKQQNANQMAIAKMQHEVNLRNAKTLAERQNEEERYNYVNEQLQQQAKFIDAQISYTQMATSKDIAILQVAGQLTQTGMNNETALRQAQLQTTAQLAGKQMELQTQLQTQGTFGQRTTADLLKTSLTNPWLQQLSGMAPGYGAPGGPGASGGGGTGGILQPLLQGWNAEVPSGAVSPFGGTEEAPDYGSMFGQQLAKGTSPNTYTDWLDPSRLDPIGEQSLFPQGLSTSFPKLPTQGLQEPASFGSGQSVGDQLAGGGGQPASWGPYAANAQSQAGWGGYAPLATPPPRPNWQQWQAMTPFERASYRSLVEAAEPWALGVQNLRLKWGAEGGPTAAPGTTQLGAMTRDPMGRMGISQTAEVFGEDPQMYWQGQQKDWSKGQQPSVQQIT